MLGTDMVTLSTPYTYNAQHYRWTDGQSDGETDRCQTNSQRIAEKTDTIGRERFYLRQIY